MRPTDESAGIAATDEFKMLITIIITNCAITIIAAVVATVAVRDRVATIASFDEK